MKSLIVGLAALILSVVVYVASNDLHDYQRYNNQLRYAAEEVSCSVSLYQDLVAYSEGKFVFNQAEGIKAAENHLKSLLKLDDGFNPLSSSYWKDNVKYNIYFFDDSNTVYPFLFVNPVTNYSHLIKSPTVVVTINAGKPPFRTPFLQSNSDVIRSAAHEFKAR